MRVCNVLLLFNLVLISSYTHWSLWWFLLCHIKKHNKTSSRFTSSGDGPCTRPSSIRENSCVYKSVKNKDFCQLLKPTLIYSCWLLPRLCRHQTISLWFSCRCNWNQYWWFLSRIHGHHPGSGTDVNSGESPVSWLSLIFLALCGLIWLHGLMLHLLHHVVSSFLLLLGFLEQLI